ncbi:ESPR-type extended signal peptide-containing protein [Escherichia coli]|nr:ESPR-type extended signal peptide-containing protein [Escherichia coli]MDM4882663.1 ESPR-type extended signal peptide-containing protein [Escherichia coli]
MEPCDRELTVTSETAKSRGKKSGRSKLLISALVAGGMLSSFGALANAGNDNGQGVDYGSGSAGDGWVAIGKGAKANTFMNTSGSSTAVGYDAKLKANIALPSGQKPMRLAVHQWPLGLVQYQKAIEVSTGCLFVFIGPILNGPRPLFKSIG